MTFRTDHRGAAIQLARLFLGLIVAAALFFIVTEITDPLLDYGPQTQTAQEGQSYLTEAIDYWPVFALGISFFGYVAYTIYSKPSGVP